MRFPRHASSMVVATVMFATGIRLSTVDIDLWHALVAARKDYATASTDLQQARSMKVAIEAQVPVAKQHLGPIRLTALYGAVALFNLAHAHHLRVGTLTVSGVAQGALDLGRIARPLPGTGERIRQVSYVFKTGFDDLGFLTDFILHIPETGGYLEAIRIRQDSAVMRIGFLGG